MKCQCEFCKKVFNVEDKYAGKNVGCPNCNKLIVIQEYVELEEIKLTSVDNTATSTKNIAEDEIILTEDTVNNNTLTNKLSPWGCFYHNVTKNYCNFEGRVGRREYWFFCLFAFIITVAADVLLTAEIGSIIVALGLFLPGTGLTVRRFHDINKPTNFAIVISILSLLTLSSLPIIMIIGGVAGIIEIIFACIEGDKGKNQYGEPPQA